MKNKSGRGHMVSNAPNDYVDWDDPNELVDRLQLLLASRVASSNSHANGIRLNIEDTFQIQI